MSEQVKTVGILVIGNEILDGIVLDTNSNWIENQISAIGLEMTRLVTVRDDAKEIGVALDFLSSICDVIITSGGLGPTHDDMTLVGVAQAMGVELKENADALAIVERQYKMLKKREIIANSEITPSRRKMASLPIGGVPLDNTVGGAPGVRVAYGKSTVFCLPGVPSEMKSIFKDSVEPWLSERASTVYLERVIEFEFRDESVFAPVIDAVMTKNPGVWIKSMPRTYGSTNVLRVWVSVRGEDESDLKVRVERTIQGLEEETGHQAKIVESERNLR